MSVEVIFLANEWNNQNDNTLNRMPTPGGYPPPMGGDPRRRPPTPNEQSGKHFIKEGVKASLLNLLYAAIVIGINLIVLHYFKNDIWSLYWLNAGFIIILPIFGHFNGIEVEVWNVRTGQTWTETQGCRGIVIGVIVLLVITWLIFSLADAIFPPYNYMTDFILYAVPTIISGGFALNRLLDVYTGVTMSLAGRKLMKDAAAPRVQNVMEKHGALRGRISVALTIGTVAICVLALIGQYVQVLFVTPKIKKELDVVAVYHSGEDALPFSDDVLSGGRKTGEFSEFSTRFKTTVEADLAVNGVTGHYVQDINCVYDFDADRWVLNNSTPLATIRTADISGTWDVCENTVCTDNAGSAKDFAVILVVDELTTEKTSGVVRFKDGDQQIFESKFEGTVVLNGGELNATATMEKAYDVFFDEGHTELTFKYQASDDTIVLSGDYAGHLERQ